MKQERRHTKKFNKLCVTCSAGLACIAGKVRNAGCCSTCGACWAYVLLGRDTRPLSLAINDGEVTYIPISPEHYVACPIRPRYKEGSVRCEECNEKLEARWWEQNV